MLRITRKLGMYLNPSVLSAQYAVRGLIPMRATEIRDELEQCKDAGKYPFDSLVFCNIGNPQSLRQKPLTFFRYVMSLTDAPFLLDNDVVVSQFPADAVARAREYVSKMGHGSGAYTDSMGLMFAREAVTQYINKRDCGVTPLSTAKQICLTDGASSAVKMIMQLLVSGPSDAVMYPIPQYPLYTAQLALLNGKSAPYFLKEEAVWGMQVADLTRAYDTCVAEHKATPRLFVCINPGNPTGSVMDRSVMEAVVRFCHERHLVLLADEVYQENLYLPDKPFLSFRKVVLTMPAPYNTETMLVSLHSTSKGFIGECGRRGGFMEMTNLPEAMYDQVVKLASINLCANVNGQIMTSLMCTPPREGDASYESYWAEYNAIKETLRGRAEMLARELNNVHGISSQPVEGAMYAFPRITLPEGYAHHNDEMNAKENRTLELDARWALELLEESGIVVVPGSGFGQEKGTLHFRTTILPPTDDMKRLIESIAAFQTKIYTIYA